MDHFANGMFIDLLKVFEQKFNFTTKLYKRIDGNWGSLDQETGYWNGMISNILDGSADFICAPMYMKIDRSTAVRFLPPLGGEFDAIAIRNPDTEDASWLTFFTPFQWLIWLAIILAAVIMALTTWSIDYFYIKVDAPVRSKKYFFGNTIVLIFVSGGVTLYDSFMDSICI
jgi:hypothetical protein